MCFLQNLIFINKIVLSFLRWVCYNDMSKVVFVCTKAYDFNPTGRLAVVMEVLICPKKMNEI